MPCRDYDFEEGRVPKATLDRMDKLARMLCNVLGQLEKANTPSVFATYLDAETHTWWEKHKEQDRIREASEQARRVQERIREKAYNKLTPSERKALGL